MMCWKLYGLILALLLRRFQKQPKETPPKTLPIGPRGIANKYEKPIKTQNPLQNVNLHGSAGKT